MKECLECGFLGSNSSFREGCPMCGNWDSWKIKTVPQEKEKPIDIKADGDGINSKYSFKNIRRRIN